MERGILWTPLLGVLITLTWLGWRSYRQVESYRHWAKDFDTAKYDLAAVAGLKNRILTWGIPHPQGPIELQTVNLDLVQEIDFCVDGIPLQWPPQALPQGKRFTLQLLPAADEVPFADRQLAIAWCQKLKQMVGRTP